MNTIQQELDTLTDRQLLDRMEDLNRQVSERQNRDGLGAPYLTFSNYITQVEKRLNQYHDKNANLTEHLEPYLP
jgi:hypothetical protein